MQDTGSNPVGNGVMRGTGKERNIDAYLAFGKGRGKRRKSLIRP